MDVMLDCVAEVITRLQEVPLRLEAPRIATYSRAVDFTVENDAETITFVHVAAPLPTPLRMPTADPASDVILEKRPQKRQHCPM